MNELSIKICERILIIAKEKFGWDKTTFLKESNISRTTFNNWANGTRGIGRDYIDIIINVLNIKRHELYNEEPIIKHPAVISNKSPDEIEAFNNLKIIFDSNDEDTILAIKQNLKQFAELVNLKDKQYATPLEHQKKDGKRKEQT